MFSKQSLIRITISIQIRSVLPLDCSGHCT
nr:MAG TPA: hypothetical protein [Bacteriophage sp.]